MLRFRSSQNQVGLIVAIRRTPGAHAVSSSEMASRYQLSASLNSTRYLRLPEGSSSENLGRRLKSAAFIADVCLYTATK